VYFIAGSSASEATVATYLPYETNTDRQLRPPPQTWPQELSWRHDQIATATP